MYLISGLVLWRFSIIIFVFFWNLGWCENDIKWFRSYFLMFKWNLKNCNKNIIKYNCLILILLYVNGCVGSDVVYILEDILGYVFL